MNRLINFIEITFLYIIIFFNKLKKKFGMYEYGIFIFDHSPSKPISLFFDGVLENELDVRFLYNENSFFIKFKSTKSYEELNKKFVKYMGDVEIGYMFLRLSGPEKSNVSFGTNYAVHMNLDNTNVYNITPEKMDGFFAEVKLFNERMNKFAEGVVARLENSDIEISSSGSTLNHTFKRINNHESEYLDMDIILEKISEQGMDSLSEKEINFLKKQKDNDGN